ncbi:TylF/MycF/NovP-related O-methyltransferase [Methylobacterium sp. P1-11]|uniref:TylF/MycF/NovP-related O-methyltransferase n=1 Tax=Methylobacterium sp. P1-11 TaxID=2024616 RepID=UPI001566C53C|nr:TylF/MycF/NovP-related O-methyltransferase [Methylobacterium sp. P1-11]
MIEYGLPKSQIVSQSNYSPWFADPEFHAAFQKAGPLTAVDHLRCYELWQLTEQAAVIEGDILEVGAWRGGTAILFGLASKRFLATRPVHVCDTFEGIVKAGVNDPFYKGGEFSDTSLDFVQSRMSEFDLGHVQLYKGIFPDDTAHLLRDKIFSLVHIDVDVYQSAKETFYWAWDRLSVGGVVVFDDYGWVDCAGVIKFVNEELRARHDCITLHNLNGHAVIIKTRLQG